MNSADVGLRDIGGTKSLFTDASWSWGLVALHQQRRDGLVSAADTLGAGACILDANLDGWMDILLVGGSGQRREHGAAAWWQQSQGHRLFLNEAGIRFRDVTNESGLETSWGMGCASGDLDLDGDEEVLITGYDGSRLYENLGDGRFRPVESFASEGWGASATIAEFDGDGQLDIYLNRFINYRRGQRIFESSSGFAQSTAPDFRPALYDALPNQLWLNRGGLRFEESASKFAVANSEGRSLQSLWWPESGSLIVLNAPGSPLAIWRQRGAGEFSDDSADWRSSVAEGVNGGIPLDSQQAVLGTPAGSAVGMIRRGDVAPNPWDLGLMQDPQLALQGFGLAAGDYDNDGAIDLYSAHGLLTPDADAPDVPQGQPDLLFLGGETFRLVEQASRFASSRAVLTLDANNDGALDLLVTHNNGSPSLLLNRGGQEGRWLGLAFSDTDNRALSRGVSVQVKTGDQVLEAGHYRRGGFLGQSDPRLHIGLGDHEGAVDLIVTWPDGSRSRIDALAANRYWRIRQSGTDPEPLSVLPASTTPPPPRFQRYHAALGDSFLRLAVHLLDVEEDTDIARVLRTTAHDDPSLLPVILGSLPERPAQNWLYLLELALHRDDPESLKAAIRVLRDWELEESVLRLLPLLAHPDISVRCDTAELFQAWFVEEEAVIHRKWLALTPLVRMLDQPEPEARRCAMAALAEAERFRGFHRLVAVAAGSDRDLALQAIETLGRIRQREAIPVLESIAARHPDDIDLQAAVSRALALLAAGDSSRPALVPARITTAAADLGAEPLLALYRQPGPAAERQLLDKLRALNSAATWESLLDAVPENALRTRRIVTVGLLHASDSVQRVAIAHSQSLLSDPKLADLLWRRLLAPGLSRDTRMALLDKLGDHDPQRAMSRLDSLIELL